MIECVQFQIITGLIPAHKSWKTIPLQHTLMKQMKNLVLLNMSEVNNCRSPIYADIACME